MISLQSKVISCTLAEEFRLPRVGRLATTAGRSQRPRGGTPGPPFHTECLRRDRGDRRRKHREDSERVG